MKYEEMSLPLLAKVSKAETAMRELEREKDFALKASEESEKRVRESAAKNDELKSKLQSVEAELILARQEQKYYREGEYSN